MTDQPIFCRVDDAARLLSISRSKAYELIAKGQIPHIVIGKSIRVPIAGLEALAERQQKGGR